MVWQQIDTAPTGIPVQIWDGDMQCTAVLYSRGWWRCIGASGYECDNDFGTPTHWHPLNEPPEKESGDARP